MNKLLITLLIFCLGTNAILGQETISIPLSESQIGQENSSNPDFVEKEQSQIKKYFFASALDRSILGAGVSVRKNIMAYDFAVHSYYGVVNTAYCTASPTLYFSSSGYRPYASVGVGPFILFNTAMDSSLGITVPARFGVESDGFSVDIGVSGVWLANESNPIVLPEARVGFSF